MNLQRTPEKPDNLDEIQQQPQALRALVAHYAGKEGVRPLVQARHWLKTGSPIAMVGMGSSLFATQFLVDARPGPALLRIGADQLLHMNILPEGMKYLFISQSGKSGELLALVQRFPSVMSQSLIITNDPSSPLAKAAWLTLPMCAGEEKYSATKTFTNTLALLSLVSSPETVDAQFTRLLAIADAMDQLIAASPTPTIPQLPNFVVGGDDLGAALARQTGLLAKEVARKHVEGLSIAEFRHGPQEIAVTGPRLLFVDQNPTPATIGYIKRLSTLGAHVTLLTPTAIPDINYIPVNAHGIGFALLATLILELAVYHAALGQPTPPGHYQVGGKVTACE